jgi:hypothetical protein
MAEAETLSAVLATAPKANIRNPDLRNVRPARARIITREGSVLRARGLQVWQSVPNDDEALSQSRGRPLALRSTKTKRFHAAFAREGDPLKGDRGRYYSQDWPSKEDFRGCRRQD